LGRENRAFRLTGHIHHGGSPGLERLGKSDKTAGPRILHGHLPAQAVRIKRVPLEEGHAVAQCPAGPGVHVAVDETGQDNVPARLDDPISSWIPDTGLDRHNSAVLDDDRSTVDHPSIVVHGDDDPSNDGYAARHRTPPLSTSCASKGLGVLATLVAS